MRHQASNLNPNATMKLPVLMNPHLLSANTSLGTNWVNLIVWFLHTWLHLVSNRTDRENPAMTTKPLNPFLLADSTTKQLTDSAKILLIFSPRSMSQAT